MLSSIAGVRTGTRTSQSKMDKRFNTWFDRWLSDRSDVIDARDYQRDKLLEMVKSKHPRYVLAAAPNSGKTLMTIMYLDWLYHNDPKTKALVLTHGLDDLRRQFKDRAQGFRADFLESDKFVIDLPHSVRNTDLEDVDVLVVDEAHHFYFAPGGMIQKFIDKMKPDKQLLLTGTPSDFIMANKAEPGKFHISFIDVYSIHKQGYAQEKLCVTVDTTTFKFGLQDYNKKDELKNNVEIGIDEIESAMTKMMQSILYRLRSHLRMKPEMYKAKHMTIGQKNILKREVGKTMIVCRKLDEAKAVEQFLVNFGYGKEEILRSTHDTDVKGLQAFQDDDRVKFAIVIFRGVLGFDFAELENIIDLTVSRNVNRNFQLFCRLLRKSQTGREKLYMKVVPEDLGPYFKVFMTGVMHLMYGPFLERFNGKNFLDLPAIPKNFLGEIEKEKTEGDEGRKKSKKPNLVELNLQSIFDFIALWHKGDKEEVDAKAYCTIKRAMQTCGYIDMKWSDYTYEELEAKVREIRAEYDKLVA